MKEKLLKEIHRWLNQVGISPLHFWTIFSALLSAFCFYYYVDKWDTLPGFQRYAIKLVYWTTALSFFFCIVDFACQ
jgi:hypothetical protein